MVEEKALQLTNDAAIVAILAEEEVKDEDKEDEENDNDEEDRH